MYLFIYFCPPVKAQSKNGGRLVCVGKKTKWRTDQVSRPPFPCAVANLLIFEVREENKLLVLCYRLKNRKNWSRSKPYVKSSFELSPVPWVLSVAAAVEKPGLKRISVPSMAFYFRQDSMFHFILYLAQSILATFCVCHLNLHSRFNFFAFNIQLWFMQHSSFRFRHSTFHKQQSSFRIRPSIPVECTFIFSHPAFSICLLSFRFRPPTLGTVLASFCIWHLTFRTWLLPAGQRPIEIVGTIDLIHPHSNDGRESVEKLPSRVDSGDLLHSRQTRRWQQIEHGRSPGWRCTFFEGGECCPTDCLL